MDEPPQKALFVLLDSLVLLPPEARQQVAAAYDDAALYCSARLVSGLAIDDELVMKVRRQMYRSVADALWRTVGGRPRL